MSLNLLKLDCQDVIERLRDAGTVENLASLLQSQGEKVRALKAKCALILNHNFDELCSWFSDIVSIFPVAPIACHDR